MITPYILDDGEGQSTVRVYRRVREAILRNELEPGGTYSQGALAKFVDGSRTPLREAIRMLAQEGLVLTEANRRIQITPLDPVALEDLQISRVALESAAVQVTQTLLAPEQVAELEGLLAQMSHFFEDRDFDRLEIPHRAFHALLVSGVGSRTIAFLALQHDHVSRYRRRYALADEHSALVRLQEHRRILDYIKLGDGRRAANEVVNHYVHLADYIFTHMEPAHEPSRLYAVAEALRAEPANTESVA